MFAHRATTKELLDDPSLPFEDVLINMQELHVVNKLLGGYSTTVKGLKNLLKDIPKSQNHLHIAEIGCGDGTTLMRLASHPLLRHYNLELTGIDIKEACIDCAKKKHGDSAAHWIASSYEQTLWQGQKPDIIFSSLFCHHFSNNELLQQIVWMDAHAKLGFFINDLHRHPLAYYAIKFFTQILSSSYLVKHDAPISVLRSFTRKEWQQIIASANRQATIQWRWAFRYLITFHKTEQCL